MTVGNFDVASPRPVASWSGYVAKVSAYEDLPTQFSQYAGLTKTM